MALTARQRNALPAAAFLDRANRRFPVPTRAQAKRAGISEAQRGRTLRNVLARAAQAQPRRQAVGPGGRKQRVKTVTPATARRAVKSRGGGAVASVAAAPAGRARRQPAQGRRASQRRAAPQRAAHAAPRRRAPAATRRG